MTRTRYASGLSGEEQAERYLLQKGMICLDRRYRAEDGEIDLVMQDGAYIVFVEVKYRPGGLPGSGLAAITPAKQRRMLHAAQRYLLDHDLMEVQPRFDAVEITRGGILHIPNMLLHRP